MAKVRRSTRPDAAATLGSHTAANTTLSFQFLSWSRHVSQCWFLRRMCNAAMYPPDDSFARNEATLTQRILLSVYVCFTKTRWGGSSLRARFILDRLLTFGRFWARAATTNPKTNQGAHPLLFQSRCPVATTFTVQIPRHPVC